MELPFLDELRRMNKRQVGFFCVFDRLFLSSIAINRPFVSDSKQIYYQVLNFGMIVSTALMIWKGLMILTGSESPIVVVLRFVSVDQLTY